MEMGDRRNVRIEEKNGGKIYLYNHWNGTELPGTVANALDRGRDRWTDESYLTRIIFNEMTRGQEEDTTGFGISTYQCDENHPDVVVDFKKQTVDGLSFEEFVRSNA